MQKMMTIQVGSLICWQEALEGIDKKFSKESASSDFHNMTLVEHLEHFIKPSWTEDHSFCNYAQSEDGRTESYAVDSGLCFILNPGDGIFNR